VTPKQRQAWLKKVQRDSDREKLTALRLELKRARALAKQRRIDARASCRNARATVKEWAKLERQRARDAITLKRLNAKHTCEVGRETVRTLMETKTAKATRLAEARSELQRERVWSRAQRRLSTRVKKSEARDEVLANLTPDEAWLYSQVRAKLKPRPRMSMTEVFHHWLHEHQGEALRMLDEHAQHDVQALEEDERAYMERRRAG
jgi:hypothetical protein